MIGLSRTDLTPEEKVYLAAATVAMKGTDGVFSRLAGHFGVTRPTLYAVEREIHQMLSEEFEPRRGEPGVLWVRVDQRQLQRAAIAMRCVGPSSVPVIEELLPILYPGVHLSYGSLHALLAGSEHNAERFNRSVPLGRIEATGLDEMFSQGQPVLSGIDLASGFVAILKLASGRSAQDWSQALSEAKTQGFSPAVVVKDAALGIAAGVTEVFPDAEQRDDCFHAAYELGKASSRLEKSAYAAIEQEDKAARQLEALRKRGDVDLRAPAQKLRRASERCVRLIELYDSFEKAMRDALEGLEAVNIRTMQLRGPMRMREALLDAAGRILCLPDKGARKAGRYLKNRTPGLVRYCEELHSALNELIEPWGVEPVRWASVLWHADEELYHGRKQWIRNLQLKAMHTAWTQLRKRLPTERISLLLTEVARLFARRHRASSAIEGVHAGLRPHLYVHKSVSQGFLELHRAYQNLRPARNGPRKGTSAYERLTGQPVADWLSTLGFPPSSVAIRN